MTFVLGLTGSIGMGKSTTAKLFAEAGVPVWDADAAVHRLYAPGGLAQAALKEAFPNSIAADGHVDRSVLRALIAKDPKTLDQINAIVHPLVANDRSDFLAEHQGLVLLDVPLLFETGLESFCDKVVVCSVDAETQKKRVLDRGTMSETDFQNILARQVSDAEKRRRADYVVITDTLEHAKAQVETILADIKRVMADA